MNKINQSTKSILVLTDFTSCARNAADYALVLADKFKANLLLFNSYFVPICSLDSWPAKAYPGLLKNGQSKLKQEVQRMEVLLSASHNTFHPRIEYITEGGSVAENVSGLITERGNILMVVMGGYRARNNDDFQNGTAISEVLGKAKCPAVIVPEFDFLKN